MSRIVILTGAGISAESGIPTFRDANGLWESHRIEDVASPAGFARDPALVHRFYNLRRRHLQRPEIAPNAAHLALAEYERNGHALLLVTQNIDDLHQRAGSQALIHMHGELLKIRCQHCHALLDWRDDCFPDTPCPRCARSGGLRPHVVWFGEMPLEMERIEAALQGCELFIAIGTSGTVYPAAGFVQVARACGAHTIEVNLQPSGSRSLFHELRQGPASIEVPALLNAL